MNASNEELPQESQEQSEEEPTFYDPIEYYEQWVRNEAAGYRDWLRRQRGLLTERQQAHVAERTAFKARLEAEAEARWGKGKPEEE